MMSSGPASPSITRIDQDGMSAATGRTVWPSSRSSVRGVVFLIEQVLQRRPVVAVEQLKILVDEEPRLGEPAHHMVVGARLGKTERAQGRGRVGQRVEK